MSKWAAILITILVAIEINGQEKELNFFLSRSSEISYARQESRNIIWSSDFSDKSEWIIDNDADNFQNWKITNNSPLGYYGTSMGKIKSTTQSNNFALFDSEFMGDGTHDQKGNITNSQPFSCVGYSRVILEFQSYYFNWFTRVSVKITVNGGDTWHEIEVHEDLINRFLGDNPEFIRLDITDVASGEENVQIRFYFDGLEYDRGIAWMVDDVVVFEPNGLEADLLSVDNYWLMGTEEEFKMNASIQNLGSNTVHSITFAYQLNDFYSDTVTIDTLSIGTFENFQVSHPQKYTALEKGRYYPSVEILKINNQSYGIGMEGEYIDVYESENKNNVLFELFTSASCEDCFYLNEFYDAMQAIVSPNLISTIRYPMDFPDDGDAYFNEDSEIRKDYYGIVQVPFIYRNGKYLPANSLGISSVIGSLEKDSPIDININAEIIDSVVYADLKVSSGADLQDLQLYLAVNEKQTEANQISENEKIFTHVLLKMLPDGNGTYISGMNAADTLEYSFSCDLRESNMEEINDIELVAFIEDLNTYDIIQSENIDLSWYVEIEDEDNSTSKIKVNNNELNMEIYPNPSNGILFISNVQQADVFVYDILGNLVLTADNYSYGKAINISNLPNGNYIIKVYSGNETATRKLFLSK